MSQDAPQETQPQLPDPQDEPGSGGSSIRLIVLVCFLLLFGGLLGYDRLVARPAAEKADQVLADLIEERSNMSEPIERENVHQAIGREPSEYENQNGSRYKMDVFRWRAGAPWRSYEVYVVYTGTGDDLFYHTHYLNQQPPENERPGFELEIPTPAPPPET